MEPWPPVRVGRTFFVYLFHRCCSRLGTSKSSGSTMSCMEHLQLIFTSARSMACSILLYRLDFVVCFVKTNNLVTFCSQGAEWHLVD
jgi:hypothetical protein